MELKKYLETLEDGKSICIGSRSAFVYFGPKEEIDTINDDFHSHLTKTKKYLKKANEDLKNLFTLEFDSNLSETEFNDEIKSRANKVATIVHSIDNYEKFIKGYRNPFGREVLDTFEKEVDECLAILISGDEYGDFWMKQEYDARHNK